MKKVLKVLGVLLGVLVVGLIGLAVFIQVRGVPAYAVEKVDLKVEVTPERVARGKQIAVNLCVLCHQDPTTQKLTGRPMFDLPSSFGKAFTANITKDPTHGIGTWSDGELAVLLRTGVHPKTGRYVPPWMIKMPNISDEDLASVIAFLRSDDPLVAPADVPDRPSEPAFLTKALSTFVFRPYDYPKQPIVAPDRSDKVAYGRYLADAVYACYPCHSAEFKTVNELEPAKTPGYYGGSNALKDVNGKAIYSANLTPDDETGIGRWSEAEFTRAVRDGFRPDGTMIHPPMERYKTVPADELSAIYAYLRTVPAIRKARPASASYAKAAVGGGPGKEAYYKYGCQYCHGKTGVGTADLRPAHAKFPTDDARIAAWIKNASSFNPDTRMPTYEGLIAEADVAPLVGYVRELGRQAAP